MKMSCVCQWCAMLFVVQRSEICPRAGAAGRRRLPISHLTLAYLPYWFFLRDLHVESVLTHTDQKNSFAVAVLLTYFVSSSIP